MKTTLILSTIVMLFVWAGCSENMNLTDPSGSQNIAQYQPNNNDPRRPELLWSLNEFKIWTESEGFVQKSVSYNSPVPLPPLSGTSKYLITFDASSNAGRFTNGYQAVAEVSKDGEVLYTITDFSNKDSHAQNKIEFENSENFVIQFYIVLMQVDGGKDVIPGDATYLTLSDIKIYKIN